MTNEEIIKKAIEKAIKNGFTRSWADNLGVKIKRLDSPKVGEAFTVILFDEYKEQPVNIYELIFSHEFAKAFWGEEEHTFISITNSKDESNIILDFHGAIIPNGKWQFHLHQMVLSKDPIKYLEDYV